MNSMGRQHIQLLHVKGKSRDVPLYYAIIKYMLSPEHSENRDEQIFCQASLVGNMFTIDSRKVLGILKELALVTDSKTWIKGLKCVRKAIQELQVHNGGTSEG